MSDTQITNPEPESSSNPATNKAAIEQAVERAWKFLVEKAYKIFYDPIVRRYLKAIERSYWLDNLRGILMVVAIVTASMSYQAILSIPRPLRTRKVCLCVFMFYNSISFLASLSVIAANVVFEAKIENHKNNKPPHETDENPDHHPMFETSSSLHGDVPHHNVKIAPEEIYRVKTMALLLLLAILTIVVAYVISILCWFF